jgi:hypothetical protein
MPSFYGRMMQHSGSGETANPNRFNPMEVEMLTRSTQTIAHFTSPFRLTAFEAPLPAGDYRIDYDEEQIEVASRLAWHRTGAFIFLPAIGSMSTSQQMVPIAMSDLHTLLQEDHENS